MLCLKFELGPDKASSSRGESASGSGGNPNEVLLRGFLVTGSSDCTVCVWDLWTERLGEDAPVHGEVRAVLRGHGGGVLDLRIDERWIVSWLVAFFTRLSALTLRPARRTPRSVSGRAIHWHCTAPCADTRARLTPWGCRAGE